jgi:hypothetical protein
VFLHCVDGGARDRQSIPTIFHDFCGSFISAEQGAVAYEGERRLLHHFLQ